MGWSMGGGILAGVGIPLLAKATGSFAVAAAVLALVALPPLLLTVWTTRGRDPLPQPGARAQGFFSVLKVPAFRRTAALFVCAWTSIAVLSALVPFYVEHVVQAPQLLDAVFAAIQVSALLTIPVIAWMARRLQKHGAFAVAIAAWALALGGLGLGLQAAGSVEGAATQGEAARLTIRALIGPVPAVVLLGAAALALPAPPLTRAAHHHLRQRVARAA
jgi:Na+/melibiose symporter-like transporter